MFTPNYSGGRDQEDHGSKPAWANSSMKPYLEKNLHKKGLVEWLKVVGPEFKPQYPPHTKKKEYRVSGQ
jgi:hypothetical protein